MSRKTVTPSKSPEAGEPSGCGNATAGSNGRAASSSNGRHGAAAETIALRDYFAAAAVQAVIMRSGRADGPAAIADMAYQVADALLQERAANGGTLFG